MKMLEYLAIYAIQFFLIGCIMAGTGKNITRRWGQTSDGLGASGLILVVLFSAVPGAGVLGTLVGSAITGYLGFSMKWTADKQEANNSEVMYRAKKSPD